MSVLLSVKDLVSGYDHDAVIRGISLDIDEGEFVGLIGPNGSGKTTLLRTIIRVLKPYSGDIFYRRRRIADFSNRELAKEIAMLSQFAEIPFSFTVEEIVLLGRFSRMRRFGGATAEDREAASKAMEFAGVSLLAGKKITQLSGGEQQRVYLAQAIAQEPNFLLLDEPISHLDINYQIGTFELLRKVNERGVTVLTTLHDLNFAGLYCKRVVLIHEGKIFAQGKPEEVINAENVRKVYHADVEVMLSRATGKPCVNLKGGAAQKTVD